MIYSKFSFSLSTVRVQTSNPCTSSSAGRLDLRVLRELGGLALLPAPYPQYEILVKSWRAEFSKLLQDSRTMISAVVDDVQENLPARIGEVIRILV